MSTFMEYQKLNNMFNQSAYSATPLYDPQDSKLVNLASGYVTAHNNEFYMTTDSTQNNQSDLALRMTMSKNIAQETAGYAYSLPTVTLFNLYENNTPIVQDFDFREQVYENFMANLGYASLYPLYHAQLFNDFISPTHYRYFNETILLLKGSITRRTIANESWGPILYHTRGNFVHVRKDLKEDLISGTYNEILNLPIYDLIPLWLNTEPGFHDLLYFNKLVFGRPELGRIQ